MGVRGQRYAPAAFYPRERPDTHCTGGWVGPRAGLDGGKSHPPPGFDPRTFQPVASPYTYWATRPTHTFYFTMAQKHLWARASSLSRIYDHTQDTPHSIWILWTKSRTVAETSTWQHTTLTTDTHVSGGIRTLNPSKRAAADPRLRSRGHRGRP